MPMKRWSRSILKEEPKGIWKQGRPVFKWKRQNHRGKFEEEERRKITLKKSIIKVWITINKYGNSRKCWNITMIDQENAEKQWGLWRKMLDDRKNDSILIRWK